MVTITVNDNCVEKGHLSTKTRRTLSKKNRNVQFSSQCFRTIVNDSHSVSFFSWFAFWFLTVLLDIVLFYRQFTVVIQVLSTFTLFYGTIDIKTFPIKSNFRALYIFSVATRTRTLFWRFQELLEYVHSFN